MRQRSVLVSMVLLVGLVAAACTSGSSSDDSSSGSSPSTTAELTGVWSTEDGAITFEFLDDGETVLFTTEHFEECINTHERDGDQVVVGIECDSLDGAGESSRGAGDTGVLTVGAAGGDFYSGEWTLGVGGVVDEGVRGLTEGESAGGLDCRRTPTECMAIIEIVEDPSSTVSYQEQEGVTLLRGLCEDRTGICR